MARMWCLILLVLPVAVQCRKPLGRVVGGSDAADGAHPWQLSLRNAGSHSCGASLIGSTKAVCAAHCVGTSAALYTLIGGTNQRSCPGSACTSIRPANVYRHPDFVNSGIRGYPNDVSVLTWADPVAEQPGKLEFITITTNADWLGGECYISGWGRLTGGGVLPENLQEAKTDILTTAECEGYWSAAQVHETHVCIYDRENQRTGACNGDSGGPLVCRASASSRWELVGATSWGANGCSTSLPSVYTRLSEFIDWINNPTLL